MSYFLVLKNLNYIKIKLLGLYEKKTKIDKFIANYIIYQNNSKI